MHKRSLCLLILLWGALFNSSVFAHKVNLFAYPEGNEILVEGYFVDGRKAKNSKVVVTDSNGVPVSEGETDGQGMYRFALSLATAGDLTITLDAGMGHKSSFVLEGDLSQQMGSGGSDNHDHGHDHNQGHDQGVSDGSSSGHPVVANEVLVAEIRSAVNNAIRPLAKDLAMERERAKLTEIIAALGYLFGVLGLFAFYKSRQAK